MPPSDTWRSAITSSSADCTFAGARLISSASTKLANTGPSSTSKRSIEGAVDAGADDVRRQQVGRELDAGERAAERPGERRHHERLAEAGHAFEQAVPAGDERDEHPLEHPVLADDHAAAARRAPGAAARRRGSRSVAGAAGVVGVIGRPWLMRRSSSRRAFLAARRRRAVAVARAVAGIGAQQQVVEQVLQLVGDARPRTSPASISSRSGRSPRPGRMSSRPGMRSSRPGISPRPGISSRPGMLPTRPPSSGAGTVGASAPPLACTSSSSVAKSSTGIAKPTPSLPPDIEAIAVLMPITSASASASGPPELPGLIGASVWISPVSGADRRLELTVETGDDAGGHRRLVAERAAEGDGRLADLDGAGLGDRRGDQVLGTVDGHDGEIALGQPADNAAGELDVVGGAHGHLVADGDHVVGGEDQAGRVVDDAGTDAVADPRRRSRSARRPARAPPPPQQGRSRSSTPPRPGSSAWWPRCHRRAGPAPGGDAGDEEHRQRGDQNVAPVDPAAPLVLLGRGRGQRDRVVRRPGRSVLLGRRVADGRRGGKVAPCPAPGARRCGRLVDSCHVTDRKDAGVKAALRADPARRPPPAGSRPDLRPDRPCHPTCVRIDTLHPTCVQIRHMWRLGTPERESGVLGRQNGAIRPGSSGALSPPGRAPSPFRRRRRPLTVRDRCRMASRRHWLTAPRLVPGPRRHPARCRARAAAIRSRSRSRSHTLPYRPRRATLAWLSTVPTTGAPTRDQPLAGLAEAVTGPPARPGDQQRGVDEPRRSPGRRTAAGRAASRR